MEDKEEEITSAILEDNRRENEKSSIIQPNFSNCV